MFVGHFALAFAAKKTLPRVSLGTLFVACQLADLLWPTLLLLGIEIVAIDPGNTALTPFDFVRYPYSHSLVALLGWGVVLGLGHAVMRRSTLAAAGGLAALVVSHWLLDVLTHRPDLPLTLGGTVKVGFGLWNHPALAVTVELGLFAAAVMVYARSTAANKGGGTLGLWILVAFLAIAYGANLLSPPPPSVTAVAWAGQAMWLLVAWGYWLDRRRVAAGR